MSNTSVFNFSDYRSFLKAHSETKRVAQSNWSLGVWSRQLKLGGTSSLTMILSGHRSPGPELTAKLISYFKFDAKEKTYFEDLIRLEKAKNDSRLKIVLMEELKKLNPNKNFELMDSKTFDSISKWYFYALRQATRLPHFKDDAKWIKKQLNFNLTEAQIKEALKTLLAIGLLKINSHQKLKISKGVLRTTDDVTSEAIQRFHEEVITLAQKSVRKFSVNERVLQATTLAFNKQQMPKAKELMRKFAEDMSALASDDGDSVYQMCAQFFPLMNIEEKLHE